MTEISAADLLAMRAQAAEAENYAIICSSNIDRLTRAYLALQIEVVKLKEAAKSAGELQAVDRSPQVPAPERLHPLHDPRPDAGLVSGGVPQRVPPTGMEHQGNDASPGHKFNGGGQAGGSGVYGGLEAGRSGNGGLAEGVSDA